jgi:membrane associated rhomboid family serine protease
MILIPAKSLPQTLRRASMRRKCANAVPIKAAFFFEVPAVLYLELWFFIQLFSGMATLAGPQQVGGIAWWAHVGGFLSGMVLCRLFVGRRRPSQPDEYGLE